MKINLPTKLGNPNNNPEIEFEQLVVIGANGSGKTRFGANIEEKYHTITHRISAQKSLSIPPLVRPKSLEVATNEFLYGSTHPNRAVYESLNYKKSNRWGNNFNTHLLNDYEKLLTLLHTEEYETLANSKEQNILSPETRIDRTKKIWELVLPHRKLKIKAGVIESYPTGHPNSLYNAQELSDGERVIFYLIGEVICSPENSIIIIDEPEMHIHKSLIKKLFDLIENERPDSSFIYLTHDIDFAFTRHNAKKIWTKSYEGQSIWDFEILDDNMPIPEQLYLEVLGSRKPVLFIEGDESSIDYQLYEQVYSDNTLKPLGSCDKVIQTVKSFNEEKSFHHIESNGIIDRDRRQEEDVARLNSKQIWVLDLAEAENLLLIEEIVKSVATHLGKNADEIFEQVKSNLVTYWTTQIDNQILIHLQQKLRREMINASSFNEKNITSVIQEVDTAFGKIDKQNIFDSLKTEFEKIRDDSDYQGILRVFNLKNALIPESKVCSLVGLNNKESYLKLVITLLKKNNEISKHIADSIDARVIKNAT